MKRVIGSLAGVLFAALALSAAATSAPAAGAATCTPGWFEATLYVGPDRGKGLVGVLRLTVARSGALSGTVTRTDGVKVPIAGQATGRAISLTVSLRGQRYLYGAGSSTRPIAGCKGVHGGVLAGPRPGDLGDWDLEFGEEALRKGKGRPGPTILN